MIATINRYCREALRRPLISACLMSGTRGDIELGFSQLNAEQRARAVELREELASELALEMTAASTATDLRRLHEGFDVAYKAVSGMIGETFKLSLIRDAVREKVLSLFFRLGPIQFLIDVPVISEIMVCGHDRIFVEKGNRMFETGLSFASESELFTVAARIAGRDGKQLTEGAPMADARLPDGSRANIVAAPTSLGGLSLTIRKFGKTHWSVADLRRNRAMSPPMERFLEACVTARKNIVISGGTGSGKTTLLNALASLVPEEERIVTIEDTSELRLLNRNLVTLESRRANMDGRGEISIRDLVRNALRMRPDRIVVGECRGGETLDMLQAMNTGHSGSMTTAHANSPGDLILRLETMVMQAGQDLPLHAIRQQIGAAVDLVVQVQKTRSLDPAAPDGARQRTVVEIAELGAFDPETGEIPVYPIFELAEETGRPRFAISGYIPSFFDELASQGLIDIATFFDTTEEHVHAA
jgi:pilus assembly protein CpaF